MNREEKQELDEAKSILQKNIAIATSIDTNAMSEVEKIRADNYLLANTVLNQILKNKKENTHFKIQAAKTVIESQHKSDIIKTAIDNAKGNNSGATFNIIINTQKQKISIEAKEKEEIVDVDATSSINEIDRIIEEAEKEEQDI